MLIFNCSKAASDFFTTTVAGRKQSPVLKPPNALIAQDSHTCANSIGISTQYAQWILHAFTVDRRRCIVAMEFDSRFSMTFSDLEPGNVEEFVNTFTERLLNNIYWLGEQVGYFDAGYFPVIAHSFLSKHDGIAFFNRSDRSVQTHINDVIQRFREQTEEIGLLANYDEQAMAFDELMNSLARNSKQHRQTFYPEVEMFCHWIQQYCDSDDSELSLVRSDFDLLRDREVQPLSPVKTPILLPDNVVSLCDYRRKLSLTEAP